MYKYAVPKNKLEAHYISQNSIMASRLAFCIAIVLIFLWSVADAFVYSPPKIFNVVNYGARADGNTDDSQVSLCIVN